MIYVLDTNTCIFHLKGTFDGLSKKLTGTHTSNILIPSVVAAELMLGAGKSAKRDQNMVVIKAFLSLFKIVSFDEQAAEHYARIRAELELNGNMIGGNDLLIAATAISNGGIVVTNNTDEFSRIRGLCVEDWTLI